MVNLCVSTNDDIELRIGSKVMSSWSTKSKNTPKIRFGYVMFASATMKIDAKLETKFFIFLNCNIFVVFKRSTKALILSANGHARFRHQWAQIL